MNIADTGLKTCLFARYSSDNLDLTWATTFTSKELFWWDVCQELA